MSENKVTYWDITDAEKYNRELRLKCFELVRQNGTVSLDMCVDEADKLFQYVMNGKANDNVITDKK